jgi:glycosyltransferase involved in cell wall biosynthesis
VTPVPDIQSVSIVLPARNEAATITRTLEALARLTYAPVEIVVVDGGSDDDTAGIVREYARTCCPRIRVIEAGPATPGRARNIGIAATTSPWIALTDAGDCAEPAWLEQLMAAAQREPGARVVYGNCLPVVETFFTRSAALAYVTPPRATSQGRLRAPSAASMLIHRDVWSRAGGFADLRAAEDLLFFDRLTHDGVPSAWAPTATVRWQIQPSVTTTFRRFSEYSWHNVRAGLQSRWHYGVARQYLLALGFAGLGVAIDPAWWMAIPAGAILRATRSIWRRRWGIASASEAFNPLQIAAVVGVLLILDAATFTGWLRAATGRPAPSQRAR